MKLINLSLTQLSVVGCIKTIFDYAENIGYFISLVITYFYVIVTKQIVTNC